MALHAAFVNDRDCCDYPILKPDGTIEVVRVYALLWKGKNNVEEWRYSLSRSTDQQYHDTYATPIEVVENVKKEVL